MLGPVFEFEILTTARRGRFYAVRAGFAFLFLMVIWQIHTAWLADTGGKLSIAQAARFALTTFYALAAAQLVLILVLTPALTAGVIADEKQRRTLQYLLTSRLSGFEIVAGKLMARMIHVAVFLCVGLPVMCLMNLLGGVDYRLVVVAVGVAASTAWFLAAVSVFASTIAKKVREALFVAYLLELLWLLLPPIFDVVLPKAPRLVFEWLGPVNELVSKTSPVPLVRELITIVLSGPSAFYDHIVETIQIQFGAGLVLVLVAAWRLRPIFRAQDGAPRMRLLSFLRSRRSWRLRARWDPLESTCRHASLSIL